MLIITFYSLLNLALLLTAVNYTRNLTLSIIYLIILHIHAWTFMSLLNYNIILYNFTGIIAFNFSLSFTNPFFLISLFLISFVIICYKLPVNYRILLNNWIILRSLSCAFFVLDLLECIYNSSIEDALYFFIFNNAFP